MHNSGHLKVSAIKKNIRHMGQITGLNNKTAQIIYNKEAKNPNLNASAAATKHLP